MITRDEIQELLHSTETYRVERTISTGDMDKFQEAICAFANADGGTLYVGVEDDGTIVGVNNVSYLLENLPNKIKDKLSFIAVVDRRTEGDIEYVAIVVQPQANPILYDGHCYISIGSTVFLHLILSVVTDDRIVGEDHLAVVVV